MRDERAVVVSRGGKVERVFVVLGTDDEFRILKSTLEQDYELQVDVRVPTFGMHAGDCARTIGETMVADAVEEDVVERGDPEEMQDLLGHDIGPQEPTYFIWRD